MGNPSIKIAKAKLNNKKYAFLFGFYLIGGNKIWISLFFVVLALGQTLSDRLWFLTF
jgi:hypothetical protein